MGRPPKYPVVLTEEQHVELRSLVSSGTEKARTIRRAHTLLLSAETALTHREIAAQLQTSLSTVHRTQKRFVEEGLEVARPSQEPHRAGSAGGLGSSASMAHP